MHFPIRVAQVSTLTCVRVRHGPQVSVLTFATQNCASSLLLMHEHANGFILQRRERFHRRRAAAGVFRCR